MNLLLGVFSSIVNFFDTTMSFLTYDILFISLIGIEFILLTILIVKSRYSFEIRMIKSIDMINDFLEKNPKINDDNLVAFNDKMKRVPPAMRTQWQQFMLYREHNASHYMSFTNCVEKPIKTSSYNQDLNVIAYLTFAVIGLSVLLSTFAGLDWTNVTMFFKNVLVIPIILILMYIFVFMIMHSKINAVTSDVFHNYQFFEKNIDKATATLPDYVDYEVLFTKREIKQGIPVLFEYLERRAQIEQEELERARQKNIEHEKYNFDKSGLESSLVLERAMTEAERFLAERRRVMAEIERADNEIQILQNKYRDYTKEYQRKVQTGKETRERLQSQLEQSASNIEANYIKKQQEEEIQRLQTLEREYDNVTEKNKKDIGALQKEINDKHAQIDKLKGVLEEQMMSEFDSYSKKVYDTVDMSVKKQQLKKMDSIEKSRIDAEERLSQKERDLEKLYAQYQVQTERLDKRSYDYDIALRNKNKEIEELRSELTKANVIIPSKKNKSKIEVVDEEPIISQIELVDEKSVVSQIELVDEIPNVSKIELVDERIKPAKEINNITLDSKEPIKGLDDIDLNNNSSLIDEPLDDILSAEHKDEPINYDITKDNIFDKFKRSNIEKKQNLEKAISPAKVETPKATKVDEAIHPTAVIEPAIIKPELAVEEPKPTKAVVVEPVNKRGRPKKVVTDTPIIVEEAPKRGRGRPKKAETLLDTATVNVVTKKPAATIEPATLDVIKKRPGRPRKVITEPTSAPSTEEPKRGRGRPKKDTSNKLDSQINELTQLISIENKNLDDARLSLEKEIETGFDSKQLVQKRKQYFEKQNLLESVIVDLSEIKKLTTNVDEIAKIDDTIKSINKNLHKKIKN